ncbi:MAG: hypothetical protein DMD48_15245 [Gemmatimonadetes bacterium]|nr:MAG: hypothetical protein DMD48_15245 [Gemmatimonadota bacterium]
MHRIVDVMSRPPKDQELVVAYGFDQVGLRIPSPVERPEYRIEFVQYGSSELGTNAGGIIFPTGIFEHVEYHNTPLGGRRAKVSCDRPILLGVERHVTNLLRAGGWIVILAREIVDEFPTGDGYAPYVKRWGIAKTFFEKPDDVRVLAVVDDAIVGFEFGARLFVLPFLSTETSTEHAKELGETLVRAVLEYRRKMRVELPPWVAEFQFVGEQELRSEQAALQERVLQVESGVKSWERRKLILVSSGAILKEALVDILKDFFGFAVDPLDEGREDFKLVEDTDAKAVITVGEVKGTNGGIKREHINQVDSHRERLGVSADVPGLLVINNQMDVTGITKRHETQIAAEHIRHARKLNVLLVRTIDLLYLMRHLEAESERRAKVLGLLRSGGGWLSAGPAGYELVPG